MTSGVGPKHAQFIIKSRYQRLEEQLMLHLYNGTKLILQIKSIFQYQEKQ